MSPFAQRLIDWQGHGGRHDLPWQKTRDPYRIWLSEIMLQQTQVATVIPYYERFLERFPMLADLAAAPVEEVMALWSGLGYYARARNLHKCARLLVADHGGVFPCEPAAIAGLPGVGRSTANAIAAFCFGVRVPILDGNVKRVLCRFLGITGHPGAAAMEKRLWREAEALLPERDVARYIQAQMDLGALVCTRAKPRCEACPLADQCVARRENRVAELPAPRPRKTLPERVVTLLVLRDGDRVLLVTRPPAGIWGGLLSLPELPPGEEAETYCARELAARIGAVSPAPTFTHGFSHFRLCIHPLICLAHPLPHAASPGRFWLDPVERRRAALPAPVRKLLSAIP